MFSYFGSKSKVIHLYPEPVYGKIIEPFAGSARYALNYFENDVLLCDVNPRVVAVWQYLKTASVKDVLSLPNLERHQTLDDAEFNSLTDAEKWLVGFELCRGKPEPRKRPSKITSGWDKAKHRIANNLYKIRHFEVYLQSFDTLDNTRATWFVDPPYIIKHNSNKYTYQIKDYDKLANWCKNLNGQTIVCAGEYDEWLPFETLQWYWQGGRMRREKIFINEN
mgnify:CR=1 FL=1